MVALPVKGSDETVNVRAFNLPKKRFKNKNDPQKEIYYAEKKAIILSELNEKNVDVAKLSDPYWKLLGVSIHFIGRPLTTEAAMKANK